MKPATKEERKVWLLAAVGAGAAVLFTLALFRVPKPGPLPVPVAPEATVGVSLNGRQDDMNLLDPSPLFLPTKWNARPNAVPVNVLRELGGAFRDYPANLGLAKDAAGLVFPPVDSVPAKPVDALAIGTPEAPFLGLGRLDTPMTVPPARDAFVQIVAVADGREVFHQELHGAKPPGDVDLYWLEFLAVVEPAGLVGPPSLTTSSGVEQVDGFFQNYLAKTLRVGARLPPGFYRIKVGP